MLVVKMDDKLKTVYDRLFARELRAREEIRNSLSCIHVAWMCAKPEHATTKCLAPRPK
jgi:hypothetical protein